MFQSHYLFKLLPAAFIFLYINPCGPGIALKTAAKPKFNTRSSASGDQSRRLLASVYRGEIGVRELRNKNDGKRVEEYLRYVGLKTPAPWCAAFVSWALGKARLNNPHSGWSPALFPQNRVIWHKSRQLRVGLPEERARSEPQQGDVFGLYFKDKGRIAHCGFIDKWSADWVVTVEGNTNEAGSREGDGVYRKRRLRNSLYSVADWIVKDI